MRSLLLLLVLVVFLYVLLSLSCSFVTHVTRKEGLPVKKGDRIVLVGNGPSILHEEWGEAIDAFEVVVRFNAAELIPKHTGTKTTVHVVTGGSDKPHVKGATKGIVYNHPCHRFLRPLPCVGCKEFAVPEGKEVVTRPTTGLVTLLHFCSSFPDNEIRIVGFDGMKTKEFDREHYFPSSSKSRTLADVLLTKVGMAYHTDESEAIRKLVEETPNLAFLTPLN